MEIEKQPIRFSSVDVAARIPVLQAALVIENLTGSFLAKLLDIEDPKASKSFNGSSSLSFSQKIHLLTDIGALEGNDKTKFFKFMEIRNTFLHDLEATTCKKCVDKIQDCEKWLLKNYPQKSSLQEEEQLSKAIQELSLDVFAKTSSIVKVIHEKIYAKVEAEQNQKFVNASTEAVEEIKSFLNDYVKELKQHGDSVSIKALEGQGDIVSKVYYHLVSQKLGLKKKGEQDKS